MESQSILNSSTTIQYRLDPRARPGRRVLLVEDETMVSMLVEDMLLELGYDAAGIAASIEEAIQLIETENFDLAVLDVHLNGRLVFPVADLLSNHATPFLFATGYGERGIPPAYRNHPILQKPYRPEDLEAELRCLAL